MMSPVGSFFDGETMESRMETIRKRTYRYCYEQLKKHVLETILYKFEKAKICVVGYYPPISKQSDGVSTKAAQLVIGWFTNLSKKNTKWWQKVGGLVQSIALPMTNFSLMQVEQMQTFGELWGSEVNKNMAQAVSEVLSEQNTNRMFFVAPYFSSQNSMGGKEPWVYPLKFTPNLTAVDSVRELRAEKWQ